jgi:site-specific DNA-methyltransferase (adenine-specific)
MDIFALCDYIPDASIDMILCDLPYGTTACSWDTVIPFEPMWSAFKRVIKPRGAVVLTATEPFASHLRMSWIDGYKYDWVWIKHRATNPVNAYKMPMRKHEVVLIFGINIHYNPVRVKREDKTRRHSRPFYDKSKIASLNTNRIAHKPQPELKLPDTVLNFHIPLAEQGQHPTQKPVALFEYLIKTYTQKGDTVLDPCVGSGTTAIAARNTGRHFICGDSSQEYVDMANMRLQGRVAEHKAKQAGLPTTQYMFEDETSCLTTPPTP